MTTKSDGRVLVIYAGGTIGMLPEDSRDPNSPLEPKPLRDVLQRLSAYDPSRSELKLDDGSVRIGTEEISPPIDSSDLDPRDWVRMVDIIIENYEQYEGFVLLHGTDTLAYTSSALAFMLENLDKPVVITGSQKPIGLVRTDAAQNLVTAIQVAAAKCLGATVVPEVCVVFRDHVLRGCRTMKFSASAYSGFKSPNAAELGVAGEHISIHGQRERSLQKTHANRNLERRAACIHIFPGMDPALLTNLSPDLRGVVLRTYGTGNTPSNDDFLAAVEKLGQNRLVVNVTQCPQGEVELGLYATSARLLSRGVVSGMDMTEEAALTKMFYVLGKFADKENLAQEDLRHAADMMQLNLRGEQRLSCFNIHFPEGGFADESESWVTTVSQSAPMVGGLGRFNAQTVEYAVLRIMGISTPPRGIIRFKVFIDDEQVDETTRVEDAPGFVGEATKRMSPGDNEIAVFMPVTQRVRAVVDNRHDNKITIVNDGPAFTWAAMNIAIFADC